MKYLAKIDILPLKDLLDPQGKTIANNLSQIDVSSVTDVRVGKHIELYLTSQSKADAAQEVEQACSKLLVNPIMESYTYEIAELN